MKWWNVAPVLLLQFVLVSLSWAGNYILAPYDTEIKSLHNQRVAMVDVLPGSVSGSDGGWRLLFSFGDGEEMAVAVDMCSLADVSIEISPRLKSGEIAVTIDRVIIRGGLLLNIVIDGKVVLQVSDAENRDKLYEYIYNQQFEFWKNDEELFPFGRKCRRLFAGGILYSFIYF